MSQLDPQIPEEMIPEVFDVAARLYAKKQQSYSPAELMQAGAEVKIPPEFIQQAITQVQSQQIQNKHSEQLYKPTRSKIKLFGIAAVLIAGGILTWTLAELRPVANTVSTSSSSSSSTSSSSSFSTSSSQEKSINPIQTDLREVDLRRANLEGADLKGKNLSSADLTRANLEGADLSGTNLRDANLTRANLENANLSSAKLNGANLNGANLKGATMPETTEEQ